MSPVALVTGASRGLGRGIADALTAAGYAVTPVSRVVADIADPDAVARVVAGLDRIDVLVNAAGALPVTDPPETLSWAAFRRPIDVDVRGVFNLTLAAADRLGEGATVINLVAAAFQGPGPVHASFGPGQAARLSLSQCLGVWLAPRGVVTHSLAPSITSAGGVGQTGIPATGARDSGLTPEQTGAAVLALIEVREPADWRLSPGGLTQWAPLKAS